jgi:hypothetical protein
MVWLLQRMRDRGKCPFGLLVAWNQDLVDDFLKAFPEAEKTTTFYTLGPPSVPMLNRAARRAQRLGYLIAGTCGNRDARSYNQRTWCRTWRLSPLGELTG